MSDIESFKSVQIDAEHGDSQAQYLLGNMYANGIGVHENDQEAFKWYMKSAEQGQENAQYKLG